MGGRLGREEGPERLRVRQGIELRLGDLEEGPRGGGLVRNTHVHRDLSMSPWSEALL